MDAKNYFDEPVAATYDTKYADMFAPEAVGPVVGFLAELAAEGRVLEMGIGTGRIAIPLARRGIPVHGIDLSEAMVTKLNEKPDAASIGVTIGDFATARAEGIFRVVYLLCNTIMNLTSQSAQVSCFRNAAAQLESGGFFVINTVLPDLQRLPFGETIRPYDFSDSGWSFDEYDVVEQGLISHHFSLACGALEQISIPFRYVWPAELDLMAEMAGMHLVERWEDWKRQPFTNLSLKHVSVWQKS